VTPIGPYVREGKLSSLEVAADGIAVGSGIAAELGLRIGDVVHASAPGGRSLDLHVVTIYEAGIPRIDRSRAYVTLRTAQTLLGKPDVVGRIEVRLVDPAKAVEATSRIERAFGYDAESWQEANANFLGIFKMQDTILGFVVGGVLLVGGFGILAVQIMIVLQKQRDIAILRSVGLRRREILQVFLLEGFVLATIGGLLGDGLGAIALRGLAKLKVHAEGFVKTDSFLIHENPRMYVVGALFALAVGLLASLLPAWRGARVEPVDVLRGQIG
jgi:lipoprotein-releasing system permease protein